MLNEDEKRFLGGSSRINAFGVTLCFENLQTFFMLKRQRYTQKKGENVKKQKHNRTSLKSSLSIAFFTSSNKLRFISV